MVHDKNPANEQMNGGTVEHQGHHGAGSQVNVGNQAQSQAGTTVVARIAASEVADSKAPQIEATETSMGRHIVAGMEAMNRSPSPRMDSGVWYAREARSTLLMYELVMSSSLSELVGHLRSAGRTQDESELSQQARWLKQNVPGFLASSPLKRWSPDLTERGYANPVFFEEAGPMTWVVRPGKSASAALAAWLHGPTIADCGPGMLCAQLDAVRAAIGDAQFDAQFGSSDGTKPQRQRLVIGVKTGDIVDSYADLFKHDTLSGKGTVGHRPVVVGRWYHFSNHPMYQFKHPGGYWGRENAAYIGMRNGKQTWAGLGFVGTEEEIYDTMVAAYNKPRDADDQPPEAWLKANPGADRRLPFDVPEHITKEQLLSAPPLAWQGETLESGFDPTQHRLNVDVVRAMRHSPKSKKAAP